MITFLFDIDGVVIAPRSGFFTDRLQRDFHVSSDETAKSLEKL